MLYLILGLVVFLGTHSIRIFADDWRTRRIERWGPTAWRGAYSLVSLLGFALLVWGYGQTRGDADLWQAPVWLRHVAAPLTLPVFVLLAATYVPGNWLKVRFGHPMLAGVKTWALAHLLVNGRPGDVLLFGAFLVWATLAFRAARRRDRLSPPSQARGPWARDALTLGIGVIAWIVFALYGHAWLIGVPPFG